MVNATVALRALCAPEVLHRSDGYTLWHNGIADGPHGLSLTVEVLDESGGRRMAGPDWQSSQSRRWPLELTATPQGGIPARPQEIIEARSPHYYRLFCSYGRFGRGLGTRLGPDGLRLEFVVHPLGLQIVRHLAGTMSPVPAQIR
jgi:hypothetical protein